MNQTQYTGGLEWEGDNRLVVSGETDFATLKNTKDLLLLLLRQFNVNDNRIVFEGNMREEFNQRLMLLEHELEGTMRRFQKFNINDPSGVKRSMDYTRLLSDKQNLLVERDSRINNLEARLKAAEEKIQLLEQEAEKLNMIIGQRNGQIQDLRRQLELRSLAIDKLKMQNLPNGQLRSILQQLAAQESGNVRNDSIKNYLSSLEREVNKMKSKETSLPQLQSNVESWIIGLPNQSRLKNKLEKGELRLREQETYQVMEKKFKLAGELYKAQIQKLKRDNPSFRITIDQQIINTLSEPSIRVSNVSVNGFVQLDRQVTVTKEIPMQDNRTRAVIAMLASHLKDIYQLYPKLKSQVKMSAELSEFMNQDIVDYEFGQIDRIVDIIHYVPQVIKVENVYAYSSERNRKTEFHLRVLIKALLEEMEKMRRQKGAIWDLDEETLSKMRAQIMDVVDVDDILKLYGGGRVKIIEVPKIVEKIVTQYSHLPKGYVTNQSKQTPVPIIKAGQYVADDNLVIATHQKGVPLFQQVPVSVLQHNQKLVSVPQVHERFITNTIERTHLQPADVIKQKMVEVDRPVFVTQQKIVVQDKIQQVEVVKEVVRYLDRIQQVIKQVPVIQEKIVQKTIVQERIVEVPKIVQKIVQVIKYQKVPQIQPFIQNRVDVVKEIVQKIVPVIHTEQRIIEVPQYIEKIVTVTQTVQVPKIVEVVRQVIKQIRIPEIVQVKVPEIIYETKIQIRQVQKIIEVPVYVEIIKAQTEIHQVPFIETIQRQTHIPVQVQRNVVIYEDRPVQVSKNVPYIMHQEVPIYIKEQKAFPVEMYYEKVKQMPTVKQKIIEKMVEVPKIVEVQRIVQKIVVVPRIIQKIVSVPQIIEKIVERQIQVPVTLPPIEHTVQVPCRVQVPVQVYVDRIVYVVKQVPKQIPADTIMVKDIERFERVKVEEVIKQRIVQARVQVPVNIHVQKVVPLICQQPVVHTIDQIIVRPVQIPTPVYLQRQVPVYLNRQVVHVQPEPYNITNNIQTRSTVKELQIIPEVHEKYITETQVQIHDIPKYIIQKQKEYVDRFEEKIVGIQHEIERIRQVPVYIEKMIPVIKQVSKVFEFEKQGKVLDGGVRVQIVEKIVPKIINVNKYIERIVQKLIQVPHLLRQAEVYKETHEKNIQGPLQTRTDVKTVNVVQERQMIRQKITEVEKKVRFIEESLQKVTEVMERQGPAVIITKDNIVEVPYVLQKIVQRVHVMPQVVQVLKYVHELIQNEGQAGLDSLSIDISVQAQQYRKIGNELQRQLADFLAELQRVKALQPNSAPRIALIEQYLAKFRSFIKYPKIREIIKEKIVEKEKVVKVPTGNSATSVREDVAKVLLIEKLIAQISRIKRANPSIQLKLDDDINFIFNLNFSGKLKDVNSRLNSQLKQFENSLQSKFAKMGGWSKEHQLMLKSFLEERFLLANVVKTTNEEIKLVRRQNEDLVAQLGRSRALIATLLDTLRQNRGMTPQILNILSRDPSSSLYLNYTLLLKNFEEAVHHIQNYERQDFQPTVYLGQQYIENLISSSLREKNKQIELLKDKLRTSKIGTDHTSCNAVANQLRLQINRLQGELMNASSNKTSIYQTVTTKDDGQAKQLKEEINRLNIIIKNTNHTQCDHIKNGLQEEIRQQKLRIQELMLQLESAENQLRNISSPKNSFGMHQTSHTIKTTGQILSPSRSTYGEQYPLYTNNQDAESIGYANNTKGIQQSYTYTSQTITQSSNQKGEREQGATSILKDTKKQATNVLKGGQSTLLQTKFHEKKYGQK